LTCAIVATVLGTCSALAASYGGKYHRGTAKLIGLPLTISAVVIGFGFLITFDEGALDFRSSWFITPLAHALIAMPLATIVVSQGARAIPRDVSAAAMTLGVARRRAWMTVDAPLLSKSVTSAAALSIAVSLGEFGASSFLSRRDSTTLPVLIAQELSRPGDLRTAHAYVVASLFIIVAVVVILGIEFGQGRSR
jgi:thiamine transport system permease protein